MKVLLVTLQNTNSLVLGNMFVVEPLALEYLGAAVRKNHDVKIVDLRLNTEPGLKEILESFQPDIIGCGACTMEVNPAKQLCKEAKKILPRILTVVGGIHATVMPADFFEDNIDVVVKGEGVDPFRKICDFYEKKKSFHEIENIYYRENGKMVFTREAPYPELDSIPFPDRTLTSHVRQKYQISLTKSAIPIGCIRGSAGCHFRCKFCSASSVRNHKVFSRSIDSILRELESIKESFIFWMDDEFLIDANHSLALAREVEKAGIKKNYLCSARSDTIVKHPEVIEAWARAGLQFVGIGMEGFRDKDLNEMRKGTNLNRNDEAIRVCHEKGVQVKGGFIVLPDFEKQDFRDMARFVRNSDLDFAGFTIYTPLPGTELWNELSDQLLTRNYDFFDALHPVLPTKMPLQKFLKEYYGLYKKSSSFRKLIGFMRGMTREKRKNVMSEFKSVKRNWKENTKIYPTLINNNIK